MMIEQRNSGQAERVYGYWLPAIGVSNPGLQILGSNECEVPICLAPGPHSSLSKEFLHSIILRPKKLLGSWNLVNPFLSKNEAWMDECAARLQPPR